MAAVQGGDLVALDGPLRRPQVTHLLIQWAAEGRELRVGIDFAFSMPAWFVRQEGCADAPAFWKVVAAKGEHWLAQCPPPFWGKPAKRRDDSPQYRRTDQDAEGSAKSVFQIGGAGAVGTGSIRGMPELIKLRAAGLAIWPFDPLGQTTVVEIYPRVLTGPGPKSQPGWCRAYLDALDWPSDFLLRARVAEREDAFDAAVSAFRMWQARDELEALTSSADQVIRLEGQIWRPKAALQSPTLAEWSRKQTKPRAAVLPRDFSAPLRGDYSPGLCACGCGATVRRRYLPGHDAKHKAVLRRAALGGDLVAQSQLVALGWWQLSPASPRQ